MRNSVNDVLILYSLLPQVRSPLLQSPYGFAVVGGCVRSEAQTLSDWMILACAFLGAAAFAFIAMTLLLQVIYGSGSHVGNILRAAVAAVSLLMAIFFATVGTLYRKSFDEDRGDAFR